jgi:DNA-binding CsgD family transcriptional regulator
MHDWLEELLTLTESAPDADAMYWGLQAKALDLGFEYCAYSFITPLPLSNPRVLMRNNYPLAWQKRYVRAGYLQIDPTLRHARKSQSPLLWSESVFADARKMWEEAQSHGLKHGWVQSCLDGTGGGSMLTLLRSAMPLSAHELADKQTRMRWLVHAAHMGLGHTIRSSLRAQSGIRLTAREVEVLKWTADGKSTQDVADILAVSKNTVNFHIKNAMGKLHSSNKTAAVVQAALRGYLS